jgi:hypothetical protein
MILKWRCVSFLVFLISLLSKAKAQFTDSTHYYLNFAATGSINQTNNDNSYLLNQALKFSIKKKTFSLNAFSSYNYGQQNKIISNNDVTASFDGNLYTRNPRFFYWGLVNYTSSYSLKINNQFQGGAGAAYSFIKNKNAYLNVSDGMLYEAGDLILDTLHDVYNTFRNSLRVSFRWSIYELFVLDGTNFFQNSLSNGNDYIIKSNIGLSVKLRKWLSLTTAFTFNKFNRTDRQNLLFTYGLSMEKYF